MVETSQYMTSRIAIVRPHEHHIRIWGGDKFLDFESRYQIVWGSTWQFMLAAFVFVSFLHTTVSFPFFQFLKHHWETKRQRPFYDKFVRLIWHFNRRFSSKKGEEEKRRKE